jgi:putative membrane protein
VKKVKAFFRIAICFGLAVLLIQLLLSGEITLFINPQLKWLVAASVIILIVLGMVELWHFRGKEMHRISVWGYLMLFLPLFIYVVIPPKTLDASMAAKKGVQYTVAKTSKVGGASTSSSSQNSLAVPDDPYKKYIPILKQQREITLDDKNFANYFTTIYSYPDEFLGKKVNVQGFVYRDENLGRNQFVVGRFAVTCCTADASVVGFLIKPKHHIPIPKINAWVEATGTLGKQKVDGQDTPVIYLQSYHMIPAKKDPYIYFFQ